MTQANELKAIIDTNKGKINLRLFGDKVPFTVANFVNLAKREFYNGLKFHRVIEDFMVQAGCPHGRGTGGPGYDFQDEFVTELRHNKAGILSMANAGPGTNGSQFFITHVPTPWLDEKHTVFGEVIGEEDQQIVNSIVQDDIMNSITIEGDISILSEKTGTQVDDWNEIINQNFPDLPKI